MRFFNKGFGKKPEKDYIERGKDAQHELLNKSEVANLWQMGSERNIMPSASDGNMVPPPSSDNSQMMHPPSSRSSGDDEGAPKDSD